MPRERECHVCGEWTRRGEACGACLPAEGEHVPYVGNWRIGRRWPITRIDRDGRGRSGGPAPRVRGSDW